MSWFKIFSAVVVANLVSWVLISILGLIFWVYVLGATAEAFTKALQDPREPSVTSGSPLGDRSPEAIEAPLRKPADVQEQLQEAAANRARQEREKKARESRIASQRKTCDYWTKELKEHGDADSRKHQYFACDRLQQMLRSR